MALITPFRGLRPPPGAAEQIASPPYDVVSTEEARAIAAGNPRCFLRVSRPEVDLPAGIDEHSDEVHATPLENTSLETFRRIKTRTPEDQCKHPVRGHIHGSYGDCSVNVIGDLGFQIQNFNMQFQ